MNILRIKWMDDELTEAILTLSTEDSEFEVFCHPCRFKEGDKIVGFLDALDPENIVRVDPQHTYIRKIDSAFKHEILGKVENAKIPLISVGQIKIELGGKLPGDIVNGEFVLFRTIRIDAHS